jgi:hypothetical protein
LPFDFSDSDPNKSFMLCSHWPTAPYYMAHARVRNHTVGN